MASCSCLRAFIATASATRETFRFFAAAIEEIGRQDLRLYSTIFPTSVAQPVTPAVIRRLEERFPAIIAGVKDSGGDVEFTEALIRRFPHLSIFTGTETILPEALTAGGRGTICGLGNIMPRLLRGLLDLPGPPFDRRQLVPTILSGGTILSRGTFHTSIKAVLAGANRAQAWRRVLPPAGGSAPRGAKSAGERFPRSGMPACQAGYQLPRFRRTGRYEGCRDKARLNSRCIGCSSPLPPK